MATRAAPQPSSPAIVVRRVKKVVGGGHHGGAWKVAYADFVTAMMAFFMLLWLLSSPDKAKLKGLAEFFSPSTASASPGEAVDSVSGTDPGLGGQRQRARSQEMKRGGRSAVQAAAQGTVKGAKAFVPDASLRVIAEELKLLLQPTTTPDAEKRAKDMDQSREGLRISLMDDANRSMFRPGTAELNPYARQQLMQIARKLARSGVQVAIEGHTDGSGGQSASNWKLSAERALAARDALIVGGLTPDRFAEVVALAATQPVYPNQPLRAENRRITIVLLAEASALPSDVSFRF